MKNGRPLRFLVMTLGGWTALRVAMLWPDALQTERAVAEPRAVEKPVALRALPVAASGATLVSLVAVKAPAQAAPAAVRSAAAAELVGVHLAGPAAGPPPMRGEYGQAEAARSGSIPPPLRPTPIAAAPSRLAVSAWLLARGGSNGTLLGGQLGGSQAGVRLTYALGTARRLALTARLATPLAGRGREAAVGIEWQPTRAPVRLVAEQRIALDGGRGGPTIMAIGGIGPTPLAAGFRLESYAQAGAIARDGIEAFADGAARVTHHVASVGAVKLDLGAGTWGAAQRGAARVDVGPSLGLVAPVGGRAVRVTLDYRQRVAGNARPGSGVALSIGGDF